MRVLVVEDSVTARKVVEAVLKASGCSVSSVGDGVSALELIEERDFDLVVMDRELPDASGSDIVRALRRSAGPNRFTAVIALSGTVTDEARAECRDAGMLGLLAKPLKAPELKKLLHVLTPRTSAAR